jgi:ABC-type taurine transport system substrate-binding protein
MACESRPNIVAALAGVASGPLHLFTRLGKLVMSDDEWHVPISKVANLRSFVLDIMKCWPHGDVDGGYLQDVAVKHGLLKGEIRHAPCGENCTCVNECYVAQEDWADGVECFTLAEWLREPG